MDQSKDDQISARVERLLTAQPAAPPEARRVRRRFEVVDRWDESGRYVGMHVQVDEEFAAAYRRPGQYVTLKVAGWPARFYVVASRPEEDVWEFLVDRRGELGPVLQDLDVGDDLLVSMPEGVGFDVRESAGHASVVFCTGSGVATVRPLIERWLAADDQKTPRTIALYYGERRADHFAYDRLLEQWEDEGVAVHRAVETDDTDEFPHRYVQHAFEADRPEVDEAFAYLSGAPVMIQIVVEKLLDLGVLPTRVKVNI